MSQSATDFRVEIVKARPQGIVSPTLGAPPVGDTVDVTDRTTLEDIGSINRALERDLLSFRTGDVTVSFLNDDGFFDDLFAFFAPTDTWSLRIFRRGEPQFWGAIVGPGSISFDRKAETVEITAYGLTKILDLTAGENVKRTFAAITWTSYSAGPPIVANLSSTAGLLSGDVLHVTDHVNSEDITVKQVVSGTQVQIEATMAHTYGAGSEVTVTTPFYRYKSIPWLVEQLFTEAGVGIAEMRLSNSQFDTLGPTPVNLSGLATLATTNPVYTCPAERNGRRYDTHLVNGTYYQDEPANAWVLEDATVRAWVDWSKYFLQSDAGPAFYARTPYAGESGTNPLTPHQTGWDLRGATQTLYLVDDGPKNLRKRTSVDGTTWTAEALVSAIPGYASAAADVDAGCDYDPVRDQVLCWTNQNGTLQLYDVAGASWTDCRQADDAGYVYGGFSYCRDLDCFIGLRSTTKKGPVFEIVAFRNGARLWKRPFPNALIQNDGASWTNLPTHSIRYVNGKLYAVLVNDGKAQLVSSANEFQTHTMRALNDSGVGWRLFAGRVNGAYQIVAYRGGLQRGIFIAAPFYAGVVDYADFEGLSVAEGLKKLAILSNALFWVDDDLQGHFVARDLYDPGAVTDVADRVAEGSDSLVWEETADYVKVSGNGFEATAGDAAFAADGIELESSFVPNEAFAQALADAYYLFYSLARRLSETVMLDEDGHIYRPLDRVTLGGGRRWLVYESDHSLADNEVSVTYLEDAIFVAAVALVNAAAFFGLSFVVGV